MSEYVTEYIAWDEESWETIQREPVIRCHDCEHFVSTPYNDGTIRTQCSGIFTFVEPDPNGFCAWGVKRGDA